MTHAGEFNKRSCRVVMLTDANFGGNIAMGFLHQTNSGGEAYLNMATETS